jgi:hypothetical protein
LGKDKGRFFVAKNSFPKGRSFIIKLKNKNKFMEKQNKKVLLIPFSLSAEEALVRVKLDW